MIIVEVILTIRLHLCIVLELEEDFDASIWIAFLKFISFSFDIYILCHLGQIWLEQLLST